MVEQNGRSSGNTQRLVLASDPSPHLASPPASPLSQPCRLPFPPSSPPYQLLLLTTCLIYLTTNHGVSCLTICLTTSHHPAIPLSFPASHLYMFTHHSNSHTSSPYIYSLISPHSDLPCQPPLTSFPPTLISPNLPLSFPTSQLRQCDPIHYRS
ncbi:hypothetical protein Pcinc_031959 [Petrolisthes cinctipes]|uniref:Uncharacterized protein n=1 Tax=Petrolisthes cinctipes TaxID=88211 RepID=A0AAE1EVB0_PETCI|nr:hypothetical protein Pcinc_031959 [Petrolisthes cinctipes]